MSSRVLHRPLLGLAALSFCSLILVPRAPAQCQSKLLASDGEGGDDFGECLDLQGDTLAIGAPFHDGANGAVYLFVRQNGEWIEDRKLQASDRDGRGHNFGEDLDLDGGVLLVGCPRDDKVVANSGAAYVYRFDGTNWIEEAKFKAPSPIGNHFYGEAVALEGDVAAVGARADDDAGSLAGAVFVYRHDGSQWNFEQKITAPDAVGGEEFGSELELVDGRLMVGAPLRTVGTTTRAGAVYHFERVGGSWTQQQVLEPADPERNADFGDALSLFGDVLVIGARDDDEAGGNSGAAYVFRDVAGTWLEQAKIVGSDTLSSDDFGHSVSWNGERIVVGAPFHDDASQDVDNVGAAYVFKEEAGSWIEEKKLMAFDPDMFNLYGQAVALVGPDAVVGSIHADTVSDSEVGAVYGLNLSTRAGWENYGPGHPGALGIPALSLSADPILGTQVDLRIGNSRGSPTFGFLFIGFADLNVPTNRDGILLVSHWRLQVFPVPTNDLVLPFDIKCIDGFAGISVYVQMIQSDPGASKNFSFTRGLRMDLGNF